MTWPERARLLWPGRVCLGLNLLFLPALFAVIPQLAYARVPQLIHPFFIWFICFVAAVHTGFLCRFSRWFDDHGYGEGMSRWLADQSIGGIIWFVVIVSFATSENSWTRHSTIQAAIVLCLLAALGAGGGVLAIEKLGLAEAPSDELQEVVAKLAGSIGIQPPRTFIMKSQVAAAWVIPKPAMLLLTDKLLRKLPHASVAAIIRHELAHLTESPWVYGARLVYIPYLFLLAMARPIIGTLGFPGWMFCLLLIVVVSNRLEKLWKRLELRADSEAAKGDTAEKEYCAALEKLYEINLIPVVTKSQRTHPDLYDRMLNLGVTPSYERPRPPETASSGILFAVGCALVFFYIYNQPFIPW